MIVITTKNGDKDSGSHKILENERIEVLEFQLQEGFQRDKFFEIVYFFPKIRYFSDF
jgi:hypothetical protein